MKYIKQFEKYIKLNNVPGLKDRTGQDKSILEYDKGDLVVFKSLDRIFIIDIINKISPNQDYHLINPFDKTDCGWSLQDEIRRATPEEIKQFEIDKTANKYNL